MTVSREKIRKWLDRRSDAKYMTIHSDNFSYEYYPSYVSSDEELEDEIKEARERNMHSIKEIYCYDDDIEQQLDENKTWHSP